jgi:hypothetical protein
MENLSCEPCSTRSACLRVGWSTDRRRGGGGEAGGVKWWWECCCVARRQWLVVVKLGVLGLSGDRATAVIINSRRRSEKRGSVMNCGQRRRRRGNWWSHLRATFWPPTIDLMTRWCSNKKKLLILLPLFIPTAPRPTTILEPPIWTRSDLSLTTHGRPRLPAPLRQVATHHKQGGVTRRVAAGAADWFSVGTLMGRRPGGGVYTANAVRCQFDNLPSASDYMGLTMRPRPGAVR